MTQKLNYTIFNDYLSLRVKRRFFRIIELEVIQVIILVFYFI